MSGDYTEQSRVIGWDVGLHGGGWGGDLDLLKRRNPLPTLDLGFRFDDSWNEATQDENHDYYITDELGERKYKGSCTGIIGEYKREFDAWGAYQGMVRKGRIDDPDDAYYKMSFDDCKAQWAKLGKDARDHGSRMHKEIEKFYNNCAVWPDDATWHEDPETSPALHRFMEFHRTEVVGRLVPFRTEQNIWHEDYEFAGQADILFQRAEWLDDPDKRSWVIVGDWKRTKKDLANQRAFRGERMLGCCSELEAVSRSEYQLQMSLYAFILQRRTGLVVRELRVGVFHHNNPSYVWLKLEPRYDIVERMLVERRHKLLHRYSQAQVDLSIEMAKRAEEAAAGDEGALDSLVELNREANLNARALRGLLKSQTVYGASKAKIMGTATG